MRVTRASVKRQCAVCERSLLLGEHATRLSPDGREYLDVCALCGDEALEHGWAREGHGLPVTVHGHGQTRRQRTLLQSLLGAREELRSTATAPHLRRVSDRDLVLVEAADLFNQSMFSRTVQGVARSLGDPLVSIVPLPGPNGEAAITAAWEITWYRYRISPASSQPVRLDARGDDASEIDAPHNEWNARLDESGRIAPGRVATAA